jgi:GT2 family glycosyltransferase
MIDLVIPLYICDQSLYPVVQRCFDAISEIKGDYRLIVVDDASPLPHDFPIDIQNEENRGFTATVNAGLRASSAEIIVVMNDDIILTQECFDKFKELKGLVIASPADTASSPDDRFGSCWAITREAYEELGLLDEQYRNFWSDMDYYQRAKEQGVNIVKWYGIVLEHPESSTYKTLGNKEELLEQDRNTYQRNLK